LTYGCLFIIITIMCGRYTLTVNSDTIIRRFNIKDYIGEHSPRYNIAPAQVNPVVLLNEKHNRIMTSMKWGLIPHWSKDQTIGYKMINARAETIAEKPSFRKPLISQRCLVPADGYYEWQKTGMPGKRPPYRIVLKSSEVFAFAGLWDAWKNEEGNLIHSYTIITTEADELISKIHPRMPVILKPENEDNWIDTENKDLKNIMPLLEPVPAKFTEMYEVSAKVGRADNDLEELILPV
jgi:putative SOS response-associated peptidase YedK